MKYFVFILSIFCILASCSRLQKASLSSASDESMQITRLDKMESEFIVNNSSVAVQEMVMNCPEESKILIEDVLRVGRVNDPNLENKISSYFSTPERKQMVKDVEEKYDNLGKLAKELKQAFEKLHEEVPEMTVPHFYSQISGFNQSVVVSDSIVGISLDKYMGTDYAPYRKLFFEPQIEQMKPSRIVEDCLYFWIESKMPPPPPNSVTMLDVMMHDAKVNWVVMHIMGKEYKDDLRFHFLSDDEATKQEWAKTSSMLLTQKNMMSRDRKTIMDVVLGPPNHNCKKLDGLLATGLPAGIKIVDDYMRRNQNCTIKDLLHIRQAEVILHGAGYYIK